MKETVGTTGEGQRRESWRWGNDAVSVRLATVIPAGFNLARTSEMI